MTTSKRKKIKKRQAKKVDICGREWELCIDPLRTGGFFETFDKTGKGQILLGTKWQNNDTVMDVLVHEIFEAILTVDNKRFDDNKDYDYKNHIFIFDHDYLGAVSHKIGTAMRDLGLLNADAIDNLRKTAIEKEFKD